MPLLCQAQQQAFTVRIEAPDAVRALLERHMELQQYRAVPDLSDAELARLILLAQFQATDLLATLGYFSPEVNIQIEPLVDVAAVRSVVVKVVTGPVTTVSGVHINFTGAIAGNPAVVNQRQTVEGSWTLPVGMPFTQAQWDNAKQQVVKKLTAQRFPAGHINESKADIDPDAHSADLSVDLDSAALYKLGPVKVQGSNRYGDELVTRLARLTPGADYVQSQLVEAQQRLTDSGYFDSAYLTLDLASDPEAATVNALVREAAMQKLVFGVGASTDTGARLSVEHTYNQVPGLGWRMVNKLTTDSATSSFSSDWSSKPDDTQWRWAVSGLLTTQVVGDTDVTGQRYRAGRFVLGQQLDQSYYMQYDRADTHSRETDISNANEALSANYAFTRRQFDSMPFPSEGWAVGGEFALGSTIGNGAEPFGRVLMRWRDYLPLGSTNETAFLRQRAGRLALRAEAGTVVVKDPNAIPFTQLFLAGGDNSVRGYQWQEIGVVKDGQITADAGRYLASGSVEWQRPIVINGVVSQWESDVFIDGGAVANEPAALDVKFGVGAGARWKSPIGPIQFDLAYGVAVQKFRAHVSVGFVF
jgi:translocation and assembly module TamA